MAMYYRVPGKAESRSAFHVEALVGWPLSEAKAHRRSITVAKSTMLGPKLLMSMLAAV